MRTEFFAPRISADSRSFWDGCREHKLLIQKCRKCGKMRWPAAYLCPDCLSEQTEIVEHSGKGTLYSYTVFHKAFHPSLNEKTPYVVAEVDLEGGIRLVSNLVNAENRKITCGDKVKLKWQDFESYTKPVFEMEDLK